MIMINNIIDDTIVDQLICVCKWNVLRYICTREISRNVNILITNTYFLSEIYIYIFRLESIYFKEYIYIGINNILLY